MDQVTYPITKNLTAAEVFELMHPIGYEEEDFMLDYDEDIDGWWNHTDSRLIRFCEEVTQDFMRENPSLSVGDNQSVLSSGLYHYIVIWMEEESERSAIDDAE